MVLLTCLNPGVYIVAILSPSSVWRIYLDCFYALDRIELVFC